MDTVEVAVLGPLELRVDGCLVRPPGRRPAALLATLALARGQAVSFEELARSLWGETLPERVKGSLQTYVGRLRRVMSDGAIVTGMAGYWINRDLVDVDLDRYLTLIDRAESEPDRAADLLDDALALWRGEPLGGLSEWLERNDLPALVERHLTTVEYRLDLWLAAGDPSAAIVRLRPLVEQYPLRESLWVRLMIALRDAGRVAEALEQFEVVRHRLADELGIDPSVELRDLHLALVTGDGGRHATSPSVATPTLRKPRQLPAAPLDFVGRESELARLNATIIEDAHRVVVLHGPGGSGKTTLAVQWGHAVAEEFPDGQLFVNVRGHGPGEPVGTIDALDHVLRFIGAVDGDIPPDVDQASALLRTALAGRRVLIVIDDALSADQVRPLIPGGSSVVVVTSRSELGGLVARDGAARVEVGPLLDAEAVQFLDRRLNPDADDAHPVAPFELQELATLCGHLPVALAVAAERAGRGGAGGFTVFLDGLRDRADPLDVLRSGDDAAADVRAIFDSSYRHLDEEAAALYRLLGLHTDTLVAVSSVAALMGVGVHRAEDVLDRLCGYHLVELYAPRWYTMHDLIRRHALTLGQQVDTEADRAAAIDRTLSWYLHTAENAVRSFAANPPDRVATPLAPAVTPEVFGTPHDAVAWFADHWRGLRTVFDAVLVDGDITSAGDLAALIGAYCDRRGAYDERVVLFDELAPYAEAVGDDAVLARCVSARGIFHGRRGEHDVALTTFERALALSISAGDRDQERKAAFAIASTVAEVR